MAAVGGLIPGTMLTIGESPSAAMAMTYLAMAGSIGVAMGNGVAAQGRGQLIGEAATVKVLGKILEAGAV